jgi:succinate--hydroxymethylglutarate CoA-transferase
MILGDLGAEIIKVEHPLRGDDVRSWGPPFSEFEDGYKESCYFFSVNRNKRSICVDLKQSRGRDILLELAKTSDVLLENFLPGKLEKLGLGYDDVLSRVCPRLIHCSITGFGPDGPYATRAGFDVIAASLGKTLSSWKYVILSS